MPFLFPCLWQGPGCPLVLSWSPNCLVGTLASCCPQLGHSCWSWGCRPDNSRPTSIGVLVTRFNFGSGWHEWHSSADCSLGPLLSSIELAGWAPPPPGGGGIWGAPQVVVRVVMHILNLWGSVFSNGSCALPLWITGNMLCYQLRIN